MNISETLSFFSVQMLKAVLNGYNGLRLSKPYNTLHFLPNTCHHKGKVTTVPAHAMKAYKGNGGIQPVTLNLSTKVNHHILIFKQYIFIYSKNMRANSL